MGVKEEINKKSVETTKWMNKFKKGGKKRGKRKNKEGGGRKKKEGKK